MPRHEIDSMRSSKGERPSDAMKRFGDEDRADFLPMTKKTRADDDLRNIPPVITTIAELEGMARFFIGKSDRVVIKLDKEYPEVVVAAEDIQVGQNQRVLVMDSGEGFIGIALAAVNPSSRFFLYDSDLRKAALSQRNAETNAFLVPNTKVLNEEELAQLLEEGVDVVVYRPGGFSGLEVIDDRIAFATQNLPVGGQLFIVSNKRSGADRHELILRENIGENVQVVGRGKGGYRVFKGTKTSETSREQKDLSTEVQFDLFDHSFQMKTEHSLFSRTNLDIGTRFLLENIDLTSFLRLLDVGCGWGAIGIVACEMNPSGSVVMADIDPMPLK